MQTTKRSTSTLVIRYAQPSSTPATHGARGYGLGVPIVQPHVNTTGHWLVTGPHDLLALHVKNAMHENDVNDYQIYRPAASA